MGEVTAFSWAVFPWHWYGTGLVRPGLFRQAGNRRMTLSDAVYVLFLLICAWLALNRDSEGGGGKRARLPLRF